MEVSAAYYPRNARRFAWSNLLMKTVRIVAVAATLLLGACAANTRIVELNPANRFPPTQSVEVLLQKPERPFVEIALIESTGGSEVDLLNDARERAKALGADAIVRQETERIYHEPVVVYDPWHDPFYFGYRRWRPYPFHGSPWGPYRMVGGGYSYILKATAIKYTP